MEYTINYFVVNWDGIPSIYSTENRYFESREELISWFHNEQELGHFFGYCMVEATYNGEWQFSYDTEDINWE